MHGHRPVDTLADLFVAGHILLRDRAFDHRDLFIQLQGAQEFHRIGGIIQRAVEIQVQNELGWRGRKDRLEIKVFGGGNVIRTSSPIGTKNAVFIREFLFREGFRITAQDLEGELPRRIHYYPTTGKVMLRKLRRREDLLVAEEEKRTQMQLKQTIEGDIDLFEGGL